MIKILALIVVIAVVVVLVLAAGKPDDLHVERSATIKAEPEKLFALVNDFHNWNDWTPYNKDPAMKKTFSGAASGAGAVYAWEGNKEVGRGSITITESVPHSRIAMNLDMLEPFEGHNKVTFSFNANGDATQVVWALDDKTPFKGKVISVFMNMDKMIGRDFEAGLAKLRTLAERN